MTDLQIGYEVEFGASHHLSRTDLIGQLNIILNTDIQRPERIRHRNYQYWSMVNDASVTFRTPHSGHELISPILPIDRGFDDLEKVFGYIRDNRHKTNTSCGFHLGVSFRNPELQALIDPVKLIFHFNEDEYLKKWNRQRNRYCQQLRDKLVENVINGSRHIPLTVLKSGYDFIEPMKYGVTKYHTINFLKSQNGYLEFRLMGGTNYHTKMKLIRETSDHIFESMKMSIDPGYMKSEYEAFLHPMIVSVNKHCISNVRENLRYTQSQINGLQQQHRDYSSVLDQLMDIERQFNRG